VLELSIGNENNQIQWSTGETSPTITVEENGSYYVVVSNTYCYDSTAFTTEFFPHPDRFFEEVICPDPPIELQTIPNSSGFVWSNGATSPSIFVNESGEYSLPTGIVIYANETTGLPFKSGMILVPFLPQILLLQIEMEPMMYGELLEERKAFMTYRFLIAGEI
jgi:hypothetical protein